MATACQTRPCILCGKESEVAVLRGMVCLSCRTESILKKTRENAVHLAADDPETVDMRKGTAQNPKVP